MISRSDVLAASETIRGHIRRTPVVDLDGITLKLELLQHTGSFKPRGTFNKVLRDGCGPAGLIAASGGNHGLAVAYAAKQLGVPAEVFVPTISSPTKVARLRSLEATVHVGGSVYAEALLKAQARQAETGALAVHAYDDPLVIAGQGTVGAELHEQAGDLDVVLVAVGGGGLASGIAAYYGSDVQVVAVETEHTNTYAAATVAGRPVVVDRVAGPAADSLGASSIGVLAFDILQANLVPSLLVSDRWVLIAQHLLWKEFHLVVEPGGAAALAAVLSGAYVPEESRKVGVVVCGSNTDPQTVIT